MLALRVKPGSDVPIFRQICEQVMSLVDGGVLVPGDRLPSTRSLAQDLGVHRSTVLRAYEELRALGYLESRPGSYTTVRRRERPPSTRSSGPPGHGSPLVAWEEDSSPGLRRLPELVPRRSSSGTGIDFERLSADPRLAPVDELRRCVKGVLAGSGNTVLDYADPGGWWPLREVLAARMARHGVAASPGEVVVTAGAQQALDLLLRFLAAPGDSVVVEAPTYGLLHGLLRLHGLEAVEVPMREDGMDLDHLERVLGGELPRRPRLVYTMPNFHNPTGITTDQPHRERLLLLCERHGVPVVEDGFEEEMKYTGRGVLPLKSMDSRGVVFYVGTFSKVVFPGLRVGWIVAPERAVPLLTNILQVSSVAGNTLAQASAARFCAGGGFEAYLRRIHRVYRRRMRVLLEELDEHMPAGVAWTRPRGGYTTWLTLPAGEAPEDELVARLAAAGVQVSPGRHYFGQPPPGSHLRLSIACVDEDEIRTGCRRLGSVLASTSGIG